MSGAGDTMATADLSTAPEQVANVGWLVVSTHNYIALFWVASGSPVFMLLPVYNCLYAQCQMRVAVGGFYQEEAACLLTELDLHSGQLPLIIRFNFQPN